MAEPKHGDGMVDANYVTAEREFFKYINFNSLRNLGFEILSRAFVKLFAAFKEMEPFVYEKFIQSSIRRNDFKTMTREQFIKEYGEAVAYAVFNHAKDHQKPAYLLS